MDAACVSRHLLGQAMKEKCLRCGIGWECDPEEPRHECRGCGAPNWDEEVNLATRVGAGMEHWILEERELRGAVLTLELSGRPRNNVSANVELNWRLKCDYRKMKGDLRLDNPREGVIAFDQATNGEDKGKWVISSFRRRSPWEIRREQTDACRRHAWARGVRNPPFDLNRRADQILCTCPPQPPCEVCHLASLFAQDRVIPGSDGTRYWADLDNAVIRDLGWVT
ncbi:MAG: hypothetical protein WB778_06580 [Thermoplasmata archaeon]|jgi:hypothetical protein